MDDGGRCLLDVINDPLLLQSFLESGSDDNSKDQQDGTSSESAVESPQFPRHTHVTVTSTNPAPSVFPGPGIEPSAEQMGFSYPVETMGLFSQGPVCSAGTGLGVGVSLVVASSPTGTPTYYTASPSGATIHHIPSPVSVHQPSPAPTPRSATPLSHAIKSPSQGPPSAHSMPPPSPLQQRSPLPSHTPSPAPSWSPAPSPATNRNPPLPSITLQQPHNQLLQTPSNMTQLMQALTSQCITQKLSLQQQLFLQQALPPGSQQPQQQARIPTVATPVPATTTVPVAQPVVQFIPAPQQNTQLPSRVPQSSVRPIQPKAPPQILPKPTVCTANQFASPVMKQSGSATVTAGPRGVGVGLHPGTAGQLVIGQGQPGVFAGPQGAIVLNQIIPAAAMGQSPILIHGNIGNMQGVHLTLRPPVSASSGQTVAPSSSQNNTTLIAALQAPSQTAQALFTHTKATLPGQQAIVIPNTGLTSQNLNLATAAIPSNPVVPSPSHGQNLLARSNIILTPRVVGPNQGLQLQQIQTPQGPILALAHSQAITIPQLQTALQNTALGGTHLGTGPVPVPGVVATGQGVISGLSLQPPQTALHPPQQQQLFAGHTVPFAEQQPVVHVAQPSLTNSVQSSQVMTQLHQLPKLSSSSTPTKPAKAPSVNLEELLKEHGIVPENTPPPSPIPPPPPSPHLEETTNPNLVTSAAKSPVSSAAGSQGSTLVAALHGAHQLVSVDQLNQPAQPSSSVPHLKLALAQDGSVILQPHTSTPIPISQEQVDCRLASPSGPVDTCASSNSMPVLSVPVITSMPSSSQETNALLARLNAGPPVSVSDVVTSVALATSLGNCSTSSIPTTTLTTSATTLIPLSVQSINAGALPITSSQVTQPIIAMSTVSNHSIKHEPSTSLSSNRSTNVITTTSAPTTTSSNLQNRVNHVIVGFQPLQLASGQQATSTGQHLSKLVAASGSGSVVPCHSAVVTTGAAVQPTVMETAKIGHNDTPVTAVTDNNTGAVMPGQKLQTIQLSVPNQQIFQQIQNQIGELVAIKSPTPQQQQILQQLITVQQKMIVQAKLAQAQSQPASDQQSAQDESESEKLLPRASVQLQPVATTLVPTSSTQQHQQQQQQQPNQQQSSVKSVPSQNVHLVNLLKQPGHQVGTQILALTPQQRQTIHAMQHQLRTLNPDQHIQLKSPLVLRVQQQGQQQTAVALPNVIQIQGKQVLNRLVPISKTALIQQQLTVDQNGALKPETKEPFSSFDDACKQLLRYHVFNSKVPSLKELRKADETFEIMSLQLLERGQRIVNKYRYLLLKESMRISPTPERVMLERLFIQDENLALKNDKASIADGKNLELPPFPESWLKQLTPSPEHKVCGKRHMFDDIIKSSNDTFYDMREEKYLRSPLKRVSVKCESPTIKDIEEPLSKRPAKPVNCVIKADQDDDDDDEWCNNSQIVHDSPSPEPCDDEDLELPNSHKELIIEENEEDIPPLAAEDNRDEDIVSKIRKELNISPLENEDDNESVPQVDFETPGETSCLTDFEPPMARTEESQESSLNTYGSGTRDDVALKYDFEMLDGTSEWAQSYGDQETKLISESEAAVESILEQPNQGSDLDLSGIEGLEDPLDDSQESIPNGIREGIERISYVGFHIPKVCIGEAGLGKVRNSDDQSEELQVQSAIKSILEMPLQSTENRSYYGDGDGELVSNMYGLDKDDTHKQGHQSPVMDYEVSLDADMGMASSESDAALDEAVRSILF